MKPRDLLLILAVLAVLGAHPALGQGNSDNAGGNGSDNGQGSGSDNGNGNGNGPDSNSGSSPGSNSGNGGEGGGNSGNSAGGNAGGSSGGGNAGGAGQGNQGQGNQGQGSAAGGTAAPGRSQGNGQGGGQGNGAGPVRGSPVVVEVPREALQSGRALPFEQIAARALEAGEGRIIDTRLLNVSGILVYELKILRPRGEVETVYYYARSGRPVR